LALDRQHLARLFAGFLGLALGRKAARRYPRDRAGLAPGSDALGDTIGLALVAVARRTDRDLGLYRSRKSPGLP
jgi:hypothetical protein